MSLNTRLTETRPEQTFFSFVTSIGVAKIANATVLGGKVAISEFAVGDGDGSYYRPTPDMTELKNELWRSKITRYEQDPLSKNDIYITSIIPSDAGGFIIREMAVFDEDGDMIAIANTADIQKPVINDGMAAEVEVTIHITVSNADAITYLVDPTVIIATIRDIKEHDASPQAHQDLIESKADAFELSAHVQNAEIHLAPDQLKNYDIAIVELGNHINDNESHLLDGERKAWEETIRNVEQVLKIASEALDAVRQQAGQISRIEDALFNDITGNPYLITFESLEGISLVKGIWNQAGKRLEC